MTVQAKFWVSEVRHLHIQGNHQMAEVKMAPVYGDANKPWSEATPQGQITMMITNPDAIGHFELGKVYPITFGGPEGMKI